MKIPFEKLGRAQREFRYSRDGCVIYGALAKTDPQTVRMRSKIEGVVSMHCDRCGKEYPESVDIELNLTLSDGPRRVEDLETVEFKDGFIDMEMILRSELEALKSDYNYCSGCKEAGEIEKEY